MLKVRNPRLWVKLENGYNVLLRTRKKLSVRRMSRSLGYYCPLSYVIKILDEELPAYTDHFAVNACFHTRDGYERILFVRVLFIYGCLIEFSA